MSFLVKCKTLSYLAINHQINMIFIYILYDFEKNNSNHFDKLEHIYEYTKEILEAKDNLVYFTHFGFYERIRTIFQNFSKYKTSSIVRHEFWWYCDASKSFFGL